MKRINQTSLFLSLFFLFMLSSSVLAQEEGKKWSGVLKDGQVIFEDDLKNILVEHQKWFDSNGQEGKQADLSGAHLQEANLTGAFLQNAILQETHLEKAQLAGANLEGAQMNKSQLADANLEGAEMNKVQLGQANLKNGKLTSATLDEAYLVDANLEGARFSRWDEFSRVASLTEANLKGANLKGAYFWQATLKNANLTSAHLTGAFLKGADLQGVIYECEPGTLPNIASIAQANGLSQMKYDKLPNSLVELRNEFKKYGLHTQKNEITYALKRIEYEKTIITKGDYTKKAMVIFGKIFLERLCKWGMEPEKPLVILFASIGLFVIPYTVSILIRDKNNGIWKVWLPERVYKDLGSDTPELLVRRGRNALKYAFYFSVLSAFNIGWHDLNVGGWLARLQAQEFSLRATGWVRCVSGFQSLLSVYLLVLWFLTNFASPFESYF
jgi:uncharacterized protein YjbI with pentapeptide repeats